jgi:putative ATP-dependent endonuclease of OLD family
MKLRKVLILNFRGIKHLDLELTDTTVLIGENNSGKTAVLEALRLCLRDLGSRGRLVFDPYDFHLKDASSEPDAAEPISIDLGFSEDAPGDWATELVARLNRQKILQVDDEGKNHVTLRVTCSFNRAKPDFEQTWSFVNLQGQPLPGVTDSALGLLQREVQYHYLSALRDAAKHFDAKGPFWRPFLKDSQLAPEKRVEIEAKLREVNDLVVGSHGSFEQALNRLRRVQDVVPMGSGDVVSIEAVPGRLFDMLAKAQLSLGTATGARVPVGRHGEGTQSLAVLMLFSAFLANWSTGTSVMALEEPEAHLHPSAVRALWRVVCGISGQKIVSTHSGDLLSEIDVHDIRRLAKTQLGIASYRIAPGTLTPEEARKLNYHVRRARGELLFARSWLLVEGETEAWIYPAAARALDIDLHKEGIRVVEYSQSDAALLAKVANALGIPWLCVIDNDQGRSKYEPALKANLAGATESDRLIFPYRNPETHLLLNGFTNEYASLMPNQSLARITKSPADPDYWTEYAAVFPARAKTRAAATIASEIERRGPSSVTREIASVLETIVTIARSA